jgi:hypothetical protein
MLSSSQSYNYSNKSDKNIGGVAINIHITFEKLLVLYSCNHCIFSFIPHTVNSVGSQIQLDIGRPGFQVAREVNVSQSCNSAAALCLVYVCHSLTVGPIEGTLLFLEKKKSHGATYSEHSVYYQLEILQPKSRGTP